MMPEPSAAQPRPAGLWRGVWKWLALLPLIWLLIYACSMTAQVGLGYPMPEEVRSNLGATYAPWEHVVLAPISTAIIQDIPEWQDTSYDELTQPGVLWVDPTPTPRVAEPPNPTPTLGSRPTYTTVALQPTEPNPLLPTRTLTSTATLFPWLPTYTSMASATSTATLSLYLTRTPTHTPTNTGTLVASATPTRTVTPGYTPTPTAWIIPTVTDTLAPSKTPTQTLTPTFTPTPVTPPPHTPTITLTPTITNTPTITWTPTITLTPTPTQPPCGGNIPSGEPDIGPPDGSFASLPCGGLLILDLPALGFGPIDLSTPDDDYDLVFYERIVPGPDRGYIELDWVSIEVGPGPSGACDTTTWYMGFNWGDYVVTNNGHLGSAYPESDNQEIPTSFLWGSPPLQTGIAIDLDSASLGIPPGLYPCIRLISPFNYPDNDPSEVDALQILP